MGIVDSDGIWFTQPLHGRETQYRITKTMRLFFGAFAFQDGL